MSDKQVIALVNIRTTASPQRALHQLVVVSHDSSQSIDQSNNHAILLDQSPCIKKPIRQCSKCIAESIESPACEFCMTCQHWMCDAHLMLHSRLVVQSRDGSAHVTHSISDYTSNQTINQSIKQVAAQSTQFPSFMCPQHRLPINRFCSDCQQYICLQCRLPHESINETDDQSNSPNHVCHSGHTTQSLIDRWIEMMNMNSINDSIQKFLDVIIETRNSIVATHQAIIKEESKTLKIVQSMFDQSINQLDQSLTKTCRTFKQNREFCCQAFGRNLLKQ